MNRQKLADYDFSEHPIDAIAVGHDTEFNFRKLSIANNLLVQNPKALFVAMNEDSFVLVGSDGRHIPGNGCTVKALEHCLRRSAVNAGKPSSTLADLIAEEHGLDPA
jgi:ribonucleotide monophosphatase NagD (HAD superfamily)